MVNYCSKGPLAATVRPWWFVRRNLFSFKLKNIFLRENDPILIQKVANELFESATVEQVFAANDEALMSSRRAWPKDAFYSTMATIWIWLMRPFFGAFMRNFLKDAR